MALPRQTPIPHLLPKQVSDQILICSFRIIFVCLTNILLITALVSLVSNSLTEVGHSSLQLRKWSWLCDRKACISADSWLARFGRFLIGSLRTGNATCPRGVSLPVRTRPVFEVGTTLIETQVFNLRPGKQHVEETYLLHATAKPYTSTASAATPAVLVFRGQSPHPDPSA